MFDKGYFVTNQSIRVVSPSVYDALSIHLSGQPLLPGLQSLYTPFTLTDGDISDRFGTFMDVLLHPGLRELTFTSCNAPFDHYVKMVQQVQLVAPGLKVLDLLGSIKPELIDEIGVHGIVPFSYAKEVPLDRYAACHWFFM